MLGHSKTVLLAATVLALVPEAAHAGEGDAKRKDPGVWRVSTGINYSTGDYGDVAKTKVTTVPVAVKYRRGGFSVRVSVPYVHIEGPGALLDTPQGRDAGFGDRPVDDRTLRASDTSGSSGSSGSSGGAGSSGGSGSSGSGSSGSGSGGSGSGGSGSSGSGSSGSGSGAGGSGSSGRGGADDSVATGSTVAAGSTLAPVAGLASNRRSGLGDVAVSLGYSFDLAATTYLDLTARVKLPTASTRKRLGTGRVDATFGADLVQDIGSATIYLGGRRKLQNAALGSALRDTWGAGAGASYRLPGGAIIGADYDWQQSASRQFGPSSEVTGWINLGINRQLRLQVFGSTGLSANSADFTAGLTISYRLN